MRSTDFDEKVAFSVKSHGKKCSKFTCFITDGFHMVLRILLLVQVGKI